MKANSDISGLLFGLLLPFVFVTKSLLILSLSGSSFLTSLDD